MDDLISIIVPIYNTEKFLVKCIESIRHQTHRNLEIILINDGSTDRSLEICEHFKKLDERIVLIDKVNEGVSIARNKGISIAQGNYVGFVDSDDFIDEKFCEMLLKRMREDKSQLSVLTNCAIDPLKRKDILNRNDSIEGYEALEFLLYLSFPASLWACLYFKDGLKGIYLNENIHYFEDFEFNFKMLKSLNKVSLCSEDLYNYTTNNESINAQDLNDKKLTCLNICDILDKAALTKKAIKQLSFTRAYFYINVFMSLCKSRKIEARYYKTLRGEARRILLSSIISRIVPIKYKVVILFCAINVNIASKMVKCFMKVVKSEILTAK